MRVHPINKLYDREKKMYFYLTKVGFEPTPTSTAAPSNTETTVIPTRPLRSLKRSYHGQGLYIYIYVRTFSWVESVLSNEEEVSCSSTQHRASGGTPTRDLVIKRPALYKLS